MSKVILSTTLLLSEGVFELKRISVAEALEWVGQNNPQNFCGHQTVKLLGLEPSTSRGVCEDYTEALCLKPAARVEFGREYSLEEIQNIGVEFSLITRK